MPSKTNKKKLAAALPSIPKELIDHDPVRYHSTASHVSLWLWHERNYGLSHIL